MRDLGVFDKRVNTVCEIGTGSGMYAEKVVALCDPRHYESYEPNAEWAAWLTGQYHLISHEADGRSLGHTASAMDLVQAHGVFVYLAFLTTYRYLLEIVRVTRPRGYVVFDTMSEERFDDATVERWLRSHENYACFLSKEYVIDFFRAREFRCIGNFPSIVGSGKSLYLVLQKMPA
jgi:predicted TPR repeat methyltransferase